MTIQETKSLLSKIQTHYQYLKIDQAFINEWHKYTQNYDYTDVIKKVEEHLVGDYSDKAPNVAYLVKYLKPITEKDKTIFVRCELCGMELKLEDFDKHHSRETSVIYIDRKRKKYFGKGIDYEKFMNMSQNEFDKLYIQFLETIKDKVSNEKMYGTSEKQAIENILKPIDFEENL